MIFPLICAIIAFLGMIQMQVRWYKQGKLTESNFVPFQVLIWSILVLSICLAVSSTPLSIIIGATLFFLCMFFGFPAIRLFFKKYLQQK
jgi:hypothetical protein